MRLYFIKNEMEGEIFAIYAIFEKINRINRRDLYKKINQEKKPFKNKKRGGKVIAQCR